MNTLHFNKKNKKMKEKEIAQLWVAEYSPQQNAFHVHTVIDMVKSNITCINRNALNQYLPIGVFETQKEAHEYTDKVKDIFRNITKN